MKRRLLEIIVCPNCHRELTCTSFLEDGAEIMDGSLSCECGRFYPIVGGIPRLLPDALLADYFHNNAEFLTKYSTKLPQLSVPRDIKDAAASLKKRTSSSFGYEWDAFSEVIEEYEANFLSYIEPIGPSYFKDKLVLDAGCGAGRHSYYAAKYGAEVVALDFSKSVEAAYRNTRNLPKTHVIQADIFNLPFKSEFDYIFSIGVLHHLPNPEDGFSNLVKLLKPNASISIWVYGTTNNFMAIHMYEPMRVVTTRIPHKALYYMSYLPAITMSLFNNAYLLLDRSKITKPAAKLMPFKYYAHFPFRTKLNDSFDVFSAPSAKYYTQEEINHWFTRAGLREVRVSGRLLKGVEKGVRGAGVK